MEKPDMSKAQSQQLSDRLLSRHLVVSAAAHPGKREE
jgi:hypothetical protein